MPDNFWELIEGGVITSDERAIELIRRCSSSNIFKQVMTKIGCVIEFARQVQRTKPLIVEGVFKTDHWLEFNHKGVPSKIVKAEIKINNEQGKFILGSHFYLIISIEGRIIGLSNVLL